MANSYFRFKQFEVQHDRCAMKVTTDGCLFGAWCAEEIIRERGVETALDIGTGSGLLSLMICQKNLISMDALEIDEAAAAQAAENINASPWAKNINVYRADALSFGFAKQYDIIVSNPPFYEKEIESADALKNKAHHGHTLRLPELLQLIKERLKPAGKFFLLLPYKRINEVESLFKKASVFIEKKLIVSPSVYHVPFRLLIKGSLRPTTPEVQLLSIKKGQEQYTKEFSNLLKDYYLYL